MTIKDPCWTIENTRTGFSASSEIWTHYAQASEACDDRDDSGDWRPVPMPRTVSNFLKTNEFKDAASCSGNTTRDGYNADSDGRVAYRFSGDYTVDEVRAILEDLERVQQACNAWRY